jgi:RNA polymerase sigma factor (TIGR02999 family)
MGLGFRLEVEPAMQSREQEHVTQLLDAACKGDRHAAAELLPLVYDELRRLASSRLSKEPGGGAGMTLEPTALVHDVYLRLMGGKDDLRWDSRGHFFGAAAIAMRRILVERARHKRRIKHGGNRKREMLDEASLVAEPAPEDVLDLDSALQELEKHDKRKHEVVMLRYFAGLGVEETANALGVSPATVKNDWTFAKAWLRRAVERLGPVEGREGMDESEG